MRSVVVPTYNEEKRIGPTLKSLLKIRDAEIIISDDGSNDKTLEKANSFLKSHKNLRVVEGAHLGKGAALRKGFEVSRGDVIGFLDADLSARTEELEKLFLEIENGVTDIAIGSREAPGSVIPIRQPIHRRLLGNFYSLIARILFKTGVRDFQCGCKAFTRGVWESIDLKEDGFVFDTELIARTAALGYKIKEIPITWQNDKMSKVNPIKDSFQMFKGLISIKIQLIKEGRR
jgi:glycosyltransferase involved in cell wall biosynthesis